MLTLKYRKAGRRCWDSIITAVTTTTWGRWNASSTFGRMNTFRTWLSSLWKFLWKTPARIKAVRLLRQLSQLSLDRLFSAICCVHTRPNEPSQRRLDRSNPPWGCRSFVCLGGWFNAFLDLVLCGCRDVECLVSLRTEALHTEIWGNSCRVQWCRYAA